MPKKKTEKPEANKNEPAAQEAPIIARPPLRPGPPPSPVAETVKAELASSAKATAAAPQSTAPVVTSPALPVAPKPQQDKVEKAKADKKQAPVQKKVTAPRKPKQLTASTTPGTEPATQAAEDQSKKGPAKTEPEQPANGASSTSTSKALVETDKGSADAKATSDATTGQGGTAKTETNVNVTVETKNDMKETPSNKKNNWWPWSWSRIIGTLVPILIALGLIGFWWWWQHRDQDTAKNLPKAIEKAKAPEQAVPAVPAVAAAVETNSSDASIAAERAALAKAWDEVAAMQSKVEADKQKLAHEQAVAAEVERQRSLSKTQSAPINNIGCNNIYSNVVNVSGGGSGSNVTIINYNGCGSFNGNSVGNKTDIRQAAPAPRYAPRPARNPQVWFEQAPVMCEPVGYAPPPRLLGPSYAYVGGGGPYPQGIGNYGRPYRPNYAATSSCYPHGNP